MNGILLVAVSRQPARGWRWMAFQWPIQQRREKVRIAFCSSCSVVSGASSLSCSFQRLAKRLSNVC